MSFQKNKSDGYCVGGRHRSATTKIYGSITCKKNKVLTAFFSICTRQKSMTITDNTNQAEGLDSFLKNCKSFLLKPVKN